MRVRVVQNITAQTLAQHVTHMVNESAHLNTDQAQGHMAICQQYARHQRVRHNAGQYVRSTEGGEQVTTNRIEGIWAGLRRQLHGTRHSVSRKHLHRYLNEAEFQYTSRVLTDGEGTVKLIQACGNRRLTYREQANTNRDSKGRYTRR